uniref:Uncharacterized protein n=1 Tax=Anguilla anguilla TaxID=7936 RepID=A0A0E9T0U3_ANGAN
MLSGPGLVLALQCLKVFTTLCTEKEETD